MRFETKAIHSGQEPDVSTGAVIPPVYQTLPLNPPLSEGEKSFTSKPGTNL